MLKVLSALLAGGILSGTAYAQSPIVHDGEYNFLRAEHGEKFVLHKGCCVLEADAKLKAADPFTVEQVAPRIRLVRSPNKLFQALEQQELAPLRVKHGDSTFSLMPKGTQTCFRKQAARAKPRAQKIKVTLMRVTRVN